MDIEEGGYKDWGVVVVAGDANSFPTEDAIEHVYVVVTDKNSGEVYEGRLFLANPGEQPKQQEYWDSVKEEQSRQLIRQLRAAQQERKFRCKDEGGF